MRRGRLIVGLVMAVVALVSYYGSRETNPITGEKQQVALSQKQEVALGLTGCSSNGRAVWGSSS